MLKAFEEGLGQDTAYWPSSDRGRTNARDVPLRSPGPAAKGCAPWTRSWRSTCAGTGRRSKVTYGQVTPAMVPEIIEQHILGGEPSRSGSSTEDGPTEYNHSSRSRRN